MCINKLVDLMCFLFAFLSMTIAMKAQARWELLDRTDVFYISVTLMVLGTLLVVSSFLALGFTGTFLGRYQTFSIIDSYLEIIVTISLLLLL